MRKLLFAVPLFAMAFNAGAQVKSAAVNTTVLVAPAAKQAAIKQGTPVARTVAVRNAGAVQKGTTVVNNAGATVKQAGTISNTTQPGTKSDKVIQQGSGLVK